MSKYSIGEHVMVWIENEDRWVYGFVLGTCKDFTGNDDYLVGARIFGDRGKKNYKGTFLTFDDFRLSDMNKFKVIHKNNFPEGIVDFFVRDVSEIKPQNVKKLLIQLMRYE